MVVRATKPDIGTTGAPMSRETASAFAYGPAAASNPGIDVARTSEPTVPSFGVGPCAMRVGEGPSRNA